jgi:hypothetical protein
MGLRFSSSKNRAILTTFLTLPTINCGDFLATYNFKTNLPLLLSYWCPCNYEVKGSIQGKQGVIGKGDWCLRSRWTFWCDCSYVGATGFVFCVFYNFFDVHVEICVWKITTYNLHKPNSDCAVFLFSFRFQPNTNFVQKVWSM